MATNNYVARAFIECNRISPFPKGELANAMKRLMDMQEQEGVFNVEDAKERGDKYAKSCENLNGDIVSVQKECRKWGYVAGAYEQDRISRQEEREKYVRVIRELVDTLQTSKNYHLGITGLDSPQEIEKKQREHETALIRNINRALKYGREAIEEGENND